MKNKYLYIGDVVLYNNIKATVKALQKKNVRDLNGVLVSMITDKLIVTIDTGTEIIEVPGTQVKIIG